MWVLTLLWKGEKAFFPVFSPPSFCPGSCQNNKSPWHPVQCVAVTRTRYLSANEITSVRSRRRNDASVCLSVWWEPNHPLMILETWCSWESFPSRMEFPMINWIGNQGCHCVCCPPQASFMATLVCRVAAPGSKRKLISFALSWRWCSRKWNNVFPETTSVDGRSSTTTRETTKIEFFYISHLCLSLLTFAQ